MRERGGRREREETNAARAELASAKKAETEAKDAAAGEVARAVVAKRLAAEEMKRLEAELTGVEGEGDRGGARDARARGRVRKG